MENRAEIEKPSLVEAQVLQNEKEWFIQAPWGRICIVAWGSCLDPPILMCHGERDTAISFKPVMKYLPATYYYVALEFPGQGRSDPFPPGLGVSLWDLVYVVELVRRHFRWERFGYMAHSYGCVIGRFYNVTHPERLNRVMEFDPFKIGFPVKLEKFGAWFNKNYTQYFDKYKKLNSPKELGPAYTWEEAIRNVCEIRGLTPDTARATIERFSENTDKGLIRFTYDQRSKAYTTPPFTPDQVKALYAGITTPTLAILAEDSIKYGAFKLTPCMLEETPTFKVRRVRGNHDVHITHPERVALFVSQFLKYGIAGLDRKAKL